MAQSVYSTPYTFSTFAGNPPGGTADGAGSDARFYTLMGVAVDSAGNVYVADTQNHTVRKVTSAGVVSTLAGRAQFRGTNDGTGSNARFSFPHGLAVDSAGDVYVADTYNSTIRKITPAGVVSTLAGLGDSCGTNDGIGSNARFCGPAGIAVDTAGNVYVADEQNHVIRKITPTGTNWVVNTLAGLAGSSGTNDGTGSSARFYKPAGVTVDSTGNIYVADSENCTIRAITPAGVVSTLAGLARAYGTNDGPGSSARFRAPRGVTVDSSGNIYVADTHNYTIRKITPEGVVSTLAGLGGFSGSADGTGNNARFDTPFGLAVDSTGNFYVADTYNATIRKITSAGVVSTLAGLAGSAGSVDGTGSNARFNNPYGVALDSAGNVYVADEWNHTIRKITSARVVSTVAGLAGTSGTNDGAGNNARFDSPQGVTVDGGGNVFVADTYNSTIRKITPAGVVSTVAGLAGNNGSTDGTGSNARFHFPSGVAVDGAGNLYVADHWNHTIRKITSAGTVSTLAGLAGASGTNDGVGSNARFDTPSGVAVDHATNVYVADSANCTIRKVTPAGVVSTLVGLAGSSGSNDGTGSEARFSWPEGVAVDSAGNLYVVGVGTTIRKITPAGVVTTLAGLAGQPISHGSADGTGSDARFWSPSGVAADSLGNLYVADTSNNTIRKGVFVQFAPANPVSHPQPPMNGQLTVTLLPPEANGQWRFPWDWVWRNSGQTVSNLVAGNYPLEFRSLAGWLAYPPTGTAVVTNGGTTPWTNHYYPTFNILTTTNTGSLTVNLGPSPPAGAAWRFWGETAWRDPSSTASDLLPDTYFIEFAPVSGFCQPPSEAVQVSAGSTTVVWAGYLMAQQTAVTADLPAPVPTNSISDLTNYPYGFNGQLQSDVGYGSGVAVQTNVVLTAAHLVFSDDTKSYVSQVYWRWQQEAGVFMPRPQAARGWYVLSGYAAQRTNDLLGGLFPGQSSPQSRNLDVAALYFPSPVAGGGYGGYLPSDATPNIWLTGTTPKMLVGYPVDGSLFGDASIVPGLMYQAGPHPYPLSLAADPVANQQVYLATWLLSYPGNSGGPLYVEMSGYYYPAGVYLGTLYSGVVPHASLVRGIDSNVVNMITWAQALGDAGTNQTGGGVITITAGAGNGSLAYLQVDLGPPAAVADGAAWRLAGSANWCGNSPFTVTVPQGGSATLEFKPIPGWNLPSAQDLTLNLGQLTTTTALYRQLVPVRLGEVRVLPNGALAMTLDGSPGGVYAILGSPDLLTPIGSWTEVLRLTNTTGQTTLTNPVPAFTPQYYRAKQL